MSNPRRSRIVVLTVGVVLLCLVGQVAAVAADATSAPSAVVPVAESGPTARGGGAHTIMFEGFEGTWPPDGGLWAAYDADGAANGEYYWDGVSSRAHSGSWSAWPANGGANAITPPTPYPNNLKSWMVYGPFDLTGYSAAWLDFYFWMASEGCCDHLYWRASGNNFATWTQGIASGFYTEWTFEDMNLEDFLGDSSVWIAFVFESDASVGAEGPFVDDVGIYGVPTPPAAFGKTAPADDGLLHNIGLSWEPSAGVAYYEYCYDSIDNDICDGDWLDNETLTNVYMLQLMISTDYYWQVRAVNSAGTTYADGGEWWHCFTPDAATFYSTGAYDGWVLEQPDEESGKGSDTRDDVATLAHLGDNAADRQYRAILDFDTSSLPNTAIVVGATLEIRRQSATGTNPFNTHGRLKVDIVEGTYFNNPALERFDFHVSGSRGNVGRFIKAGWEGWHRAPLRAPANEWINLTGPTQMRLRFELDDNDDMSADFLSFYTGNAGASNRPKLTIFYYVP